MAKSKSCNHCTKPATIHLTQIVENKITKIDLCEECAQKKGLTDPEGLDISQLLAGGGMDVLSNDGDDTPSGDAIACQLSGATFDDFKKTGRFGSAESYDLFRDKISPMLKNMHRGTKHLGKVPTYCEHKSPDKPLEPIESLHKKISQAIEEERFEDAAVLRDEIKKRSQEPILSA